MRKTPLHADHLRLGGKMVNFAGWEMPVHYGSQLNEHLAVRQHAGMFDVSHMTVVDIKGNNSTAFLRHLLANDVAKLSAPGKALYSCMLNDQGGVIDDLIVYSINPDYYLMIVNASTREKDLAWLKQQASAFKVHIIERTDLAMIAVQGPAAPQIVQSLLPAELQNKIKTLQSFEVSQFYDGWIARTGYTGEAGYEILLPAEKISDFWNKLLEAGVKPAGLGARDTLRLEAGLNLYGSDMDETVTPLESNLAWTIAWEPADRNFIGRKALEEQRAQGIKQKLVPVLLEVKGVLRNHQKVKTNTGEGEVTSGSFSPILEKGIGFARIPVSTQSHCEVEIRGQWLPMQVVKGPFIRTGKMVYKMLESLS